MDDPRRSGRRPFRFFRQHILGGRRSGSLEEAEGRVRDRMDGEMLGKMAGILLPDSLRSSALPIFPAFSRSCDCPCAPRAPSSLSPGRSHEAPSPPSGRRGRGLCDCPCARVSALLVGLKPGLRCAEMLRGRLVKHSEKPGFPALRGGAFGASTGLDAAH